MDPDVVLDASERVISQGVAGVLAIVCFVLVYFIMLLRAELRDERTSKRVELAAKEALILELQESRLTEAKSGYDLARSVQGSLDAFLMAIRGGKNS